MIKKTIIIIILFFAYSMYAQPNVSKKNFNQAVDYTIHKIAFIYAEKYSKENTDKVEKTSFDSFLKPLFNFSENNDVIIPSDVLYFIYEKNNFKKFGDKHIKELIKIKNKYENDINVEEAKNIILSSKSITNIKSVKGEDLNLIQNKIIKILSKDNPEIKSITETYEKKLTELNDEIKKLEDELPKNDDRGATSSFPKWVLWIIIIAFLTFTILIFTNISKLNKFLIVNNSPETNSGEENSQNDSMREIFQVKRDIKDIKIDVSSILNKLPSLKISQTDNYKTGYESNTKVFKADSYASKNSQNDALPTGQDLFVNGIDPEGFFPSSQIFPVQADSASYYKLSLFPHDPNKAYFSVVDTVNNRIEVVNNPDVLLIESMCEEINDPKNIIQKIITVERGVVEKQGDKWILKTKAKIRYE